METDPRKHRRLSYASSIRNRLRWRKKAGVAIAMLAVIVMSPLIRRGGASAWHEVERRYWLNQCLNFTARPTDIVLAEGAAGTPAPAIPASYVDAVTIPSTVFQSHVGGAPGAILMRAGPSCWKHLLECPTGPPAYANGAVVFCHERVSRAGHRRLVVIQYLPNGIGDLFIRNMGYFVTDLKFSTQSTLFPSGNFSGQPHMDPSLVYAGQADLQDNSHFTIGYRWPDGWPGIVDGWLHNDDKVVLTIRPGPADLPSFHPKWPDAVQTPPSQFSRE